MLLRIASSFVIGLFMVSAFAMLTVKWEVLMSKLADIVPLAVDKPAEAAALVVFISFLGYAVECALGWFKKS